MRILTVHTCIIRTLLRAEVCVQLSSALVIHRLAHNLNLCMAQAALMLQPSGLGQTTFYELIANG